MPSIDTLRGGSYLRSADLNDQEKSVTAIGYAIEEFEDDRGQKRDKLVFELAEEDRRLVMNMTNLRTVAKATGSDNYEDWEFPLPMTLFTVETQTGPGIRVRF